MTPYRNRRLAAVYHCLTPNGLFHLPFRQPSLANLLIVQIFFLLFIVSCARVGTPVGWPAGVIASDTLYIGTQDGEIRAVNIGPNADDLLLAQWTRVLGTEDDLVSVYGTPAVSGEFLYIGGYDGRLYSILISSGELNWQEKVSSSGESIVGSPVVNNSLVFVGSSDGNLYALEKIDGFEKWRFETGNKIWSTPVVNEGIVFFGSLDQHLYAVTIENGAEKWRFKANGGIATPPIITNGNVHFGAFDSVFYAIDIESGREEWKFEGANNWFWARPAVADNTVYVASLDGNLYALGTEDGRVRWLFSTESPIIGSPAIVGDNIAIPSKDNGIFLVRLRDGEIQDQCAIDGSLRASLTVHGNVIYFSDDNHTIRSLEVNRDRNLVEGWELHTSESVDEFSRWKCG
ncbi:MAG: PQQ-binding-like beta-propeller repeat protein [SAR202 cluster bacterium]|nr:PQQ-binding-like beta-propeller repeat protein [SAR202 cluster bacterium]